jgi:hypothetical protein
MARFLHFLASEETMGRFICALVTAMAIASAALSGQAQSQADAKNLIQEVSTEGCIRLWKPQPADPAKMPPDRQPGLAGVYLLTPMSTGANAATDLPTYVLTPSATINFSQHVGHKVMITGNAQAAPLPPTVQEIATPPARPEEKPSTNGMPRLTVTTFKMVTESCP